MGERSSGRSCCLESRQRISIRKGVLSCSKKRASVSINSSWAIMRPDSLGQTPKNELNLLALALRLETKDRNEGWAAAGVSLITRNHKNPITPGFFITNKGPMSLWTDVMDLSWQLKRRTAKES